MPISFSIIATFVRITKDYDYGVEHGVLNVHIPKKEKAQQPDTVKQIAVQ